MTKIKNQNTQSFLKDKLQLQIEAQREMEKRFEDRLKIPDADGKKKDESAAAAGKIFLNNQRIRSYKVKINPQVLKL